MSDVTDNVFTSAPPPAEPPKPAVKGEKPAKPAATTGETAKPTDTTTASPTEKPDTGEKKTEGVGATKPGVHGNHLALVLVGAVVLVLFIALWRMSPMAALILLAIALAALLIHLWRRWLHKRRGGDASAKTEKKDASRNPARERNRRHLWPFGRSRRSSGGGPGAGKAPSDPGGPGGPGAGPKGTTERGAKGTRRWPFGRKNTADKPEVGKKGADPTGKKDNSPTGKTPTGTPDKKPTGRRWPWSTKSPAGPGANGGPGGGGKGATGPSSPTGKKGTNPTTKKPPNNTPGPSTTGATTPPGGGRRWPFGRKNNNASANANSGTAPTNTKANPGPKATPQPTSPTAGATPTSTGPTKRRWWQQRRNANVAATPPSPAPAGIPISGPPSPPQAPRQRWWRRRRNATTPAATTPSTPPPPAPSSPGGSGGAGGSSGGTTTVTPPPHYSYTPDPPRNTADNDNVVDAEVIPNPPTTGHRWTGENWVPVQPAALPAPSASAGTSHTGSNTMGTATPIQDTSTTATRVDAYATAESTAVSSARNLADQARDARAEAGRLAGVPDMAPAADRLNQEATNLERTAETRTGLARGYAALRNLVSSRP